MNTQPVYPLPIRRRIQEYASRPEPVEFPARKRGFLAGLIEREIKGLYPDLVKDKDAIIVMRRLVIGWLCTPDSEPFLDGLSTKQLTPQQLNGLWRWVGADKDEDIQEWITRPTLREEIRMVLIIAVRDYITTQERAEMGVRVPLGELIGRVMDGMETVKLPNIPPVKHYIPVEPEPDYSEVRYVETEEESEYIPI